MPFPQQVLPPGWKAGERGEGEGHGGNREEQTVILALVFEMD